MPVTACITLAQLLSDGVLPILPSQVVVPLGRVDKGLQKEHLWVEARVQDGYLAFARVLFVETLPERAMLYEFSSWKNKTADCNLLIELLPPEDLAALGPRDLQLMERMRAHHTSSVRSFGALDISSCCAETKQFIPYLFRRNTP